MVRVICAAIIAIAILLCGLWYWNDQRGLQQLSQSNARAGVALRQIEAKVTANEDKLSDLEQLRDFAYQSAPVKEAAARLTNAIALTQRLSLVPRASLLLSAESNRDFVLAQISTKAMMDHAAAKAGVAVKSLSDVLDINQDKADWSQTLGGLLTDLASAQSLVDRLSRQKRDRLDLSNKRRPAPDGLSQPLSNDDLALVPAGVMLQPFPASKNLPSEQLLLRPAAGKLQAKFGEKPAKDLARLLPIAQGGGVIILTREAGVVVAPFDGIVSFAGAYRSYGNLVIIEHDQGHHSVLAGVNELLVDTSTPIKRGEAIAKMGTGERGNRSLYYELRVDGAAVNPALWFAPET